MAEKAHLSAKVHGHVQGVYFRYFVYDMAKDLELKGYVRNLPGGDAVEVQAEGDREQLDKLVEQLQIGPPGARVRKLETNWSKYSGQFSDFRVRY